MSVPGCATGYGRARRCAKIALFLMAVHLAVPSETRAQIDPLVYARTRNSTRASITVGHTFDAAYLSTDGRVWRTREETLQITFERPLARNLTTTLSLTGSHRSDQMEDEVRRDLWSFDQLSLGMATSLERLRFGDQMLVGLEVLLPLRPSAGPAAYLSEATTVWLLDPVAIEIAGSVTAGPRFDPRADLSAALTFLANRHLSVAGRFDLHDVLGRMPAAAFSVTLYRHPPSSGGLLWGWGFTQSVEAGRTVPGIHLLLGLER